MAYLLKPPRRRDQGGVPSNRGSGLQPPSTSGTSSSSSSPRTFLHNVTSFLSGTSGTSAGSKSAGGQPVDRLRLDNDLYHYAVDFDEVDRIFRSPLPHSTYYRPPPSPSPSPSATVSGGGDGAPTDLNLQYRKLAEDKEGGIELYSAPVEGCPIHLMRAIAIMPCRSEDALSYMDGEKRKRWDTLIEQSRIIRELYPPSTGALSPQLHTSAAPAAPATPSPFEFKRGQRRVALHYLGVRSPVMLVQHRDLEMVVAEEVRHDGTSYMKAFSAPLGYGVPLDPEQSRYVRAVLFLSAVIARPVQPSPTSADRLIDGRPIPPRLRLAKHLCCVEYVGLLHPMGLIPPLVANMVISTQVDTLRRLQQHMLTVEVARSTASRKEETVPREPSGEEHKPENVLVEIDGNGNGNGNGSATSADATGQKKEKGTLQKLTTMWSNSRRLLKPISSIIETEKRKKKGGGEHHIE